MNHELTVQAVHIKTTIFNPPARLINCKELCCAFGFAYKQAGLQCPNIQEGTQIEESIKSCLGDIEGKDIDERVREIISSYILKPDEVINEDALTILKMGYEIGR